MALRHLLHFLSPKSGSLKNLRSFCTATVPAQPLSRAISHITLAAHARRGLIILIVGTIIIIIIRLICFILYYSSNSIIIESVDSINRDERGLPLI